jgi:glycosyltransferase involved in cell wall biosynthesis
MRPTVSLCMIVRNEEANLGHCLQDAADLVDEIVIVDTGSTDRTREIASRFGATIHDFPWRDDFSAARNESIRRATGQWIFWLDADDRIEEDERRKLAALFRHLKTLDPALPVAFAMECRSSDGDGRRQTGASSTHVRLFRNDGSIAWTGRVHEAPQVLDPSRPIGLSNTDVVIEHTGYRDPLVLWRKSNRDLRLLQIDYATAPENARTLLYLGRSRLAQGRLPEALLLLRRSLRRFASDDANCARKAHALLVDCLVKLGRLPEALDAAEDGLARYADDVELLFHRGCLLSAANDALGAEACFLRLLSMPPPDYMGCAVPVGLLGFKSRYMLGVVYRQQRRWPEAEQQFRAVVAEHPGHGESWVALGQMYITQGRHGDLDRVLENLARTPQGNALVAGLQAQLCLAQQRFGEARELLELALALQPGIAWLRLTLADALFMEAADWPRCLALHRELHDIYPGNPVISNRLHVISQRLRPEPSFNLAERKATTPLRPRREGALVGS